MIFIFKIASHTNFSISIFFFSQLSSFYLSLSQNKKIVRSHTQWWSSSQSSSMVFFATFFYLFLDGNKMENVFFEYIFSSPFLRYPFAMETAPFETLSVRTSHRTHSFNPQQKNAHYLMKWSQMKLTFIQQAFQMSKNIGQCRQLFTILQQLCQIIGNWLRRLDLLMWRVHRMHYMICHHHHFGGFFVVIFFH